MNRILPIIILLCIAALLVSCDASQPTPQVTWLRFSKPSNDSDSFKLDFYRDGKLIAKRYYTDGKIVISEGDIPDGIVIEHKNGEIVNIMTYRDGKRNGPAIGFYPSGKLKVLGSYKHDNPVGVGKRYYENGKLMAEWEIIDGKETYHREYDEYGKLKGG